MEKKVTNQLNITVPQNFVDEGEGVVSFPNGLTITDNSVQRNGTIYDIDTLDINRYGGQLTGDHKDELSSLIGETIGTVKRDGRVVVNKIRYAIKENPYARLAYNLLVGGFSKNFSTETIGPPPDHDGVYRNAELVGLSQVVTQNNYNAHINRVVHNSLEQSKNDGLDVTGIEQKVLATNHVEKDTNMEETNKKTEEVKVEEVQEDESTKTQAPVVEKVDDAEATTPATPQTVKAEDTAGTEANEQKKAEEESEANTQTDSEETDETKPEVTEEQKETNNKEDKMEEQDKKVETPTAEAQANAIAEAIKNALAPLAADVASLREEQKNAFDKSAKEPEFKKDENGVQGTQKATNAFSAMDFQDRYQAQVDAAWNAVKLNNIEAAQTLRQINQVNLDKLKEAGIARNAITLEELGNFVIAPEMYNEIAGKRTDYSAILDATEWRETMSLEFAWLQRTGDIDMRNVALHASEEDADANLKPISEYSATPQRSALEEMAAVTVVATSATRFAAVDLLADAAAGYRNDYDKKRAQLVIARLQQAVNNNGFSTDYAPASDVDALTAWIDAVTSVSDTTLNGVLVFNARTFAELKSRALRAGANGPLSEILTTGELPTVFGYRFIIVPNDLMPSLGGSESIAHFVDGVAVPITHSVFFADLSTFTGRTSGGLQYDVSNSAPYELADGTVRSAYQRNELVLRGSFFRGGAVKDESVVAGVRTGTAS